MNAEPKFAEVVVDVPLILTVRIVADDASLAELRAVLQREQAALGRAVAKSVRWATDGPEVGWVDDDRPVVVGDLLHVEADLPSPVSVGAGS